MFIAEALCRMAHLSGSGCIEMESENGLRGNVWSDEHDCVPLKKRLKMLLASKRLSDFSESETEKGSESPSLPPIDVLIKKEDQQCDLQEERIMRLSPEPSCAGMLSDDDFQGTELNECVSSNTIRANVDTVSVEKVNDCSSTLAQGSLLLNYPVKVELEYADNSGSSLGKDVGCSLVADVQAGKIRTEIADAFVDDLDHIVLNERRRLLLSRKPLGVGRQVMEANCLSNPVVADTIQHSIGIQKKENHSGEAESSVSGNHTDDVQIKNASVFWKTSKSGALKGIAGSSCTLFQCSALVRSCQETKSANSGVVGIIQERDRVCSSKKASTVNESRSGQDFVSGTAQGMLSSVLSSMFVNIKHEPLDFSDAHSLQKDSVCNFPSNSIIQVKRELGIPEESYADKVDHMLLRDRIKLLASREASNLDDSRNFKRLKKIVPSVLNCSPIVAEAAKPLKINHPRKRRKTATDSVETAMEEDAPGLLQVLIEKGVSVNEMKLYGETERDETLDDSFSEDSFSELEAVISKLFSQRQSLLKFAPIRCTKGEKATYCLACLISLVEQARYLQFRSWPVEWGWCRDLQSFIFVFERHNRIVLERPEYGYATYFFELVDSLPINWQIKRLVTAMKLASCSRVTLIENKALLVGEDLTEGEARVLMEYGWIPNSGLGTMLNYCDRVVHDRRNERDSSEWRSKIAKLLMNGYNCGTIVSTDIPKKVLEHSGGQGPQIKLEL